MALSTRPTDEEVAAKVLTPQELKTWGKCRGYIHFCEGAAIGALSLDGYYTEEQLRVILKVYSFWKDFS